MENWQEALEKRGMKVRRNKTEYLCLNKRTDKMVEPRKVRLERAELPRADRFKYLGCTLQSDRRCDREVKK